MLLLCIVIGFCRDTCVKYSSSENTNQTRAFEKGLNFIYSNFQQTYNTNDL